MARARLARAAVADPLQVGVDVQAADSRGYSTVTLLARLRGWSTSVPRRMATW